MWQVLALHHTQDLKFYSKRYSQLMNFGAFVALDDRTKPVVAVGQIQKAVMQKGKAWFLRLNCVW